VIVHAAGMPRQSTHRLWAKISSLSRGGGLALGLFTTWLVLFGGCAWYYWFVEPGAAMFLCLTFILPLLHFGVVALRVKSNSILRQTYLLSIGVCAVLHFAGWGLFSRSLRGHLSMTMSSCLSYCFMVAAVGLTVESFIITALVMAQSHRIAKEVREYPFVSINFFMATFLYVAFFLSLSVAFHDRDGRAIHALSFDSPDGSEEFGTLQRDYQGCVLFKEGDDQVVADAGLLESDRLAKALREKPGAQKDLLLSHDNALALRDMTNIVSSFGHNAYFKIEVCGHANAQELKGKAIAKYDSNKGLGASRAEWTVAAIESELRKLNKADKATFEPRSCSTGDQYIVNQNRTLPGGSDPKLMAEVVIYHFQGHVSEKTLSMLGRRPRKLTLMDYVYFMVYTITTTGYGDMIPLTPQAKFISIIANLSEILFLVIFFNVVLASIRPLERNLEKVLIVKMNREG
jgi:hypothetical protein